MYVRGRAGKHTAGACGDMRGVLPSANENKEASVGGRSRTREAFPMYVIFYPAPLSSGMRAKQSWEHDPGTTATVGIATDRERPRTGDAGGGENKEKKGTGRLETKGRRNRGERVLPNQARRGWDGDGRQMQ